MLLLQLTTGKVTTCHTEKKKQEIEEKEVAIRDVVYDRWSQCKTKKESKQII
jgi:hypothetical protein